MCGDLIKMPEMGFLHIIFRNERIFTFNFKQDLISSFLSDVFDTYIYIYAGSHSDINILV